MSRPLRLHPLLVPGLTLGLLVALPAPLSAQQSGDFAYTELLDGTIILTGYSGAGGAVTVPATIDGKAVTVLGRSLFESQASVTSVSIPSSVTALRPDVFRNCTGLQTITLPAITWMANGVLSDCTELEEVILSDGATALGGFTFAGCSKLQRVTLPGSLQSIGDFCFQDCTALETISLPHGLTSLGRGSFERCRALTAIDFPATLQSIERQAFLDCSSLANPVLPAGLTTLGEEAFLNCTGMTSLTLPGSLATVPESVAAGCTSLATVVLAEGTTEIQDYAFSNCRSLTTVSLPPGLTTIRVGVFSGCSALSTLTLPTSLTHIAYLLFEGCSALSVLEIPASVQSISNRAFAECHSLTELHIPTGPTRIRPETFQNCRALHTVTLPDTVTQIDPNAFDGCAALDGLSLPSSLITIESEAFRGCASLTALIIPPAVRTINSRAFEGCSGLTTVTIPTTVTSLGAGVFSDCAGLRTATLRNSFTELPAGTFLSCAGLTTVELPTGITSLGSFAFANCRALSRFDLPPTVHTLATGCFSGCTALTEIDLSLITTLEERAFSSCHALTSVVVPDGITTLESRSVLRLPGSDEHRPPAEPHLHRCVGLRGLQLPGHDRSSPGSCLHRDFRIFQLFGPHVLHDPGRNHDHPTIHVREVHSPRQCHHPDQRDRDSRVCLPRLHGTHHDHPPSQPLTSIAPFAFSGCTALSFIGLPPGLITIEEGAFSDTSSLTAISLPAGISSIGPRGFANSPLTSIVLPAGLTILSEEAFLNCPNLQEITFPASLAQLGERVFAGCDMLTSILVEEGNQQFTSLGGVVFSADLSTLVQFPVGRGGNYLVPAQTQAVANAAFATCGLASVTLPATCAQLGTGVFEDCTALVEILVEQGNSTFASEDGVLFSLDRHELVQYPPGRPGPYAFPDDLTTIARGAFATCAQFHELFVPATITELEERAFAACPNLATLYFAGDAPTLSSSTFENPAPGFLIVHLADHAGFSEPLWAPHPRLAIDVAVQPAAPWLLHHGFPPTTSLAADPDRDRVDLLSAYAFNLDPHRNSGGSLPVPIVLPTTIELPFHSASPGIAYRAETSGNLIDWTANGVSLSDPDPSGRRTATISRDSDRRFLRLTISYDGPGTTALKNGPLKASFESATAGDQSGRGEGGAMDNLAWWIAGDGSVQDEAALDNPPAMPGSVLFLRQPGSRLDQLHLNLISETIDLEDVPTDRVVASIDVRTFEDSISSNFEEQDYITAWLEGSVDGVHFSLFEGSAIVPLRTGRLDRRSVEATHPEADDLKNLELPGGQFTTFSTEDNAPIPPAIRFIRIRLDASANSKSERIFVDNLCVGLRRD